MPIDPPLQGIEQQHKVLELRSINKDSRGLLIKQ